MARKFSKDPHIARLRRASMKLNQLATSVELVDVEAKHYREKFESALSELIHMDGVAYTLPSELKPTKES